MPLRDYRCETCNTIWEELRKDQSDPEKCPKCESDKIKREISKTNFQLKGNWFKTTKSY